MKHGKILITFIATIVLASYGLEGMETEKKLLDLPDDCICHILGFCNINRILDFCMVSKENLRLADKFWSNPAYCGNRFVKIKIDKDTRDKKTRESSLRFYKNHPDWPYSIKFITDKSTTETDPTTEDLNKILKACKNIKELNLSQCKQIKCEEVCWEHLSGLEVLNLSDTDITTEILNKMLENNKNIKTLSLHFCTNIKCKKVHWHKLSNLEYLCLSCTDITTEVLNNTILKFCKKIVSVDTADYFEILVRETFMVMRTNAMRRIDQDFEEATRRLIEEGLPEGILGEIPRDFLQELLKEHLAPLMQNPRVPATPYLPCQKRKRTTCCCSIL